MTASTTLGRHLVIDASVTLKWALDDEDAVTQATALRDHALDNHIEMMAPSMWPYEVSNALVTASRRGRVSAEYGRQALEHLLRIGVRIVDPETIVVYDTAQRHGIAAYDAAYLALAVTLGLPLWTGDRRFYEAVRPSFADIHWIGDFEITAASNR